MRSYEGGVAHLSNEIERDLSERSTGLRKQHVEGLSDLVASVVSTRSVNTAEWQSVLPREVSDEKSKERYISRFLGNELIDPLSVMAGFVPQLLKSAGSKRKTVVLMMDQSKIASDFECLMISLRVGERAVPIGWLVKMTRGNIGFQDQRRLLDRVAAMIPKGVAILLAADRFYGTASLIEWCQQQRWQYRIRLKGNLILNHQGGEITTGEAAAAGLNTLLDATFNETGVKTHIGILHEPNHPEPWIIAMEVPPSKARVLDYGLRWGIEPMFSDFKSRGFGITNTQLIHADRIERLILILTLALYWAVSTGMQPAAKRQCTQKNRRAA